MRVLAAATALGIASAGSPWPQNAYQRAQAKLAQMGVNDKLALVHGYSGPYVGDVPGNASLGTPPFNLEDGPQGVADGVTQVTAWPSALTVCMSWDPTLMYAYGAAMGAEQLMKGTNVMLGPGVNLARAPWGGRTFEYLGEDPWLAAKMVYAEVQGIQSQPVSGCVKHFVNNNQEYNRDTVSSNVPTRAQWELYYAPFMGAVDAGVGSAMCSYNRVSYTSPDSNHTSSSQRGVRITDADPVYACENADTLGDIKGPRIGFNGWMMSDWGATHSTVPAANNGLDQQMPDNSYFGSALVAAIAAGNVSMERLDDMVMRMLVPAYAIGLMDNPPTGNLNVNATSAAHNTLARQLAEQSTTLLKNDGNMLPLNPSSLKSIGVFGDQTTVVGHGSGGVVLPYVITPYQGIYTYVNGAPPPPRPANCTFVQNTDFYQPNNPSVSGSDPQDCCAACAATIGCNAFTFEPAFGSGDGTCWLKPDDSGSTPHNGLTSGVCAPAPPAPVGAVNVTYNDGNSLQAAAQLAASVDIAIVVVAITSSEGSDRVNLSLPYTQDQLVAAVVAANPNTVVVVRCPGACLMPWINSVPAVVYQLMPGQEAGNALANVLFGAVNPSGKLPVSFPASMDDTWLGNPVNATQYPGTDRGLGFLEADYSEELLIGYRWYDNQGLQPLFPFGHGLSYSNWTYSGLTVAGTVGTNSNATISALITNAGPYPGSEVAQLYIGYPAAANEPPRLLKGFNKVTAKVGAMTKVAFPLAAKDLSIFDTNIGDWRLVPGTYQVYIGSSSRDLRLTGTLTVTA